MIPNLEEGHNNLSHIFSQAVFFSFEVIVLYLRMNKQTVQLCVTVLSGLI